MLRASSYARTGVRRLLGSTVSHVTVVRIREASCLARMSVSPDYGMRITREGRLPAARRLDRRAYSQGGAQRPNRLPNPPTAAGDGDDTNDVCSIQPIRLILNHPALHLPGAFILRIRLRIAQSWLQVGMILHTCMAVSKLRLNRIPHPVRYQKSPSPS